MGALTSKQGLFKIRAWEIISIENIDIFDDLCSNIRIDKRGIEVIRILPSINKYINEEWITNKVRFNYDGIINQRIGKPLMKIGQIFKEVDWYEVIEDIKRNFNKKKTIMEGLIGSLVGVNNLLMIKKLLNKTGSKSLKGKEKLEVNVDFRNTYISNIILEKDTNYYILMGSNLRIENPIIELKLKRNQKKWINIGKIEVQEIVRGVINLGNKIKQINNIIKGKTKISLIKEISLIIGLGYRRQEVEGCKLLKYINKKRNLRINENVAELSIRELGIGSIKFKKRKDKILYLYNVENCEIKKNSYRMIIYQGHHGSDVGKKANIILPGEMPYEEEIYYINLYGIYQKTRSIRGGYEKSRKNWKIIIMLIKNLEGEINIINEKEVNKEFLRNINNIKYIKIQEKKEERGNIRYNNSIYRVRLWNYYQTDLISQNSKLMSLCKRKRDKNYN
jgi:NADH-quinone oxidoreductase subunit G